MSKTQKMPKSIKIPSNGNKDTKQAEDAITPEAILNLLETTAIVVPAMAESIERLNKEVDWLNGQVDFLHKRLNNQALAKGRLSDRVDNAARQFKELKGTTVKVLDKAEESIRMMERSLKENQKLMDLTNKLIS